ncbi:MAG: hypothetical protein LBD12_06560, partial [Clostridiales Family XIII bacterium]|nr:hypothetical protein [Clostridiales Family XIII bacterium]
IELPWLSGVFGDIVDAQVMAGTVSSLSLDYPDCYQIVLRHAGGVLGALSVDVASQRATRDLEVYGEALCLRWDGTPDGLHVHDGASGDFVPLHAYGDAERLPGYNQTIVEDAYLREIETFFATVRGQGHPLHDFAADLAILARIDEIAALGHGDAAGGGVKAAKGAGGQGHA